MWQYETTVVWRSEKEGRLHAGGNPEITVATPPDLGGPRNEWSPEQLPMGAIGSCLMMSALYYLQKSGIERRSYMSNVAGTLDKTPSGLGFTSMAVEISVTLVDPVDIENAQEALSLAESGWPVSRTLGCPVQVQADVRRSEKDSA